MRTTLSPLVWGKTESERRYGLCHDFVWWIPFADCVYAFLLTVSKKIHKCPRKTPFSGVLSLSLYDMTVRSTITLLAVMIIHGAKLPVCPHSPVDVGSVALRRKLSPVNARGINSPELCSPVLKAFPSAQPCCLIHFDHIMLCRLVFAFLSCRFCFLSFSRLLGLIDINVVFPSFYEFIIMPEIDAIYKRYKKRPPLSGYRPW